MSWGGNSNLYSMTSTLRYACGNNCNIFYQTFFFLSFLPFACLVYIFICELQLKKLKNLYVNINI